MVLDKKWEINGLSLYLCVSRGGVISGYVRAFTDFLPLFSARHIDRIMADTDLEFKIPLKCGSSYLAGFDTTILSINNAERELEKVALALLVLAHFQNCIYNAEHQDSYVKALRGYKYMVTQLWSCLNLI